MIDWHCMKEYLDKGCHGQGKISGMKFFPGQGKIQGIFWMAREI